MIPTRSLASIVLATLLLVSTAVFAQNKMLTRANSLYDAKSYSEAIEKYVAVLKKDKSNADALKKIADCYRLNNNTLKAEEYYTQLYTLKKASPDEIIYYAQSLMSNGKYSKAKEILAQDDGTDQASGEELAELADAAAREHLPPRSSIGGGDAAQAGGDGDDQQQGDRRCGERPCRAGIGGQAGQERDEPGERGPGQCPADRAPEGGVEKGHAIAPISCRWWARSPASGESSTADVGRRRTGTTPGPWFPAGRSGTPAARCGSGNRPSRCGMRRSSPPTPATTPPRSPLPPLIPRWVLCGGQAAMTRERRSGCRRG